MTAHGDFIRLTRESMGMSQKELAKKIGHADTYVAKIEVGRQRGSWETLNKIAAALNVDPITLAEKAGFRAIGVPSVKMLTQGDVKEFASLPGVIRLLLLELAPILTRYLAATRQGAEWFGEHKKLLKKRGK